MVLRVSVYPCVCQQEYTDAFLRLTSPSVCAAPAAAVPKAGGGVTSLPPSPFQE